MSGTAVREMLSGMLACIYEKQTNVDLLRVSSVCHLIVNALRVDVLHRWFFISPFNFFSIALGTS